MRCVSSRDFVQQHGGEGGIGMGGVEVLDRETSIHECIAVAAGAEFFYHCGLVGGPHQVGCLGNSRGAQTRVRHTLLVRDSFWSPLGSWQAVYLSTGRWRIGGLTGSGPDCIPSSGMKALLALCALAGIAGAAPRLEVGSINGAAFRIDVPDNWNGGLVVYCHGYAAEPVKFNEKKLADVFQVFVDQGYALAQSGYATGGWAIQEAAVDTESLRRYFVGKYGAPKETFVTGHSMGGFLTMMLMETYPTTYDAGLPLCGPLAPTETFMSRGAFDSYVLFNYYFPGVLPEATKIPKDFAE